MDIYDYYRREPTGSQAYGAARPGRTHTGDDYSHSTRPDTVRVPYIRAGVVVAIQRDRPNLGNGYGNQVTVRHSDGSRHSYAHLGRITASIGDYVTTADSPGTEGSTGFTSGSCMHLEYTTPDGKRTDPRPSVANALSPWAGGNPQPINPDPTTTERKAPSMWRVIESPAYKATKTRLLLKSDVNRIEPVPDGWVQDLVTHGRAEFASYPSNDGLVAEVSLFYMMAGLEAKDARAKTLDVVREALGEDEARRLLEAAPTP